MLLPFETAPEHDPPISPDYTSVLRAEFLRRSEVNPRYSLRRFAQQMGVSPATVSGIFNGKRRLSVRTAATVAEQLNLDPVQAAQFLHTVATSQISKTGSMDVSDRKDRPENRLDKIEMVRIAQDTYHVIADWYHYAILEYTFVPRAKMNPRAIAKALGCTFMEASDALERLKRLGLLECRNGKWVKTSAMITSGTDFPSSAMRRHHLQMLNKAKHALLSDPIHQRDFTAMTMAIDPRKIPQAKKMITEFRRKLCMLLESGKRERVYELTLELFPLSQEKNK